MDLKIMCCFVLFTIYSPKHSRVSKRRKKGGRSRATTYTVTETPKDQTYAYVGQYLNMKKKQQKPLNREWEQPNMQGCDVWDQQDNARAKMADHINIHLQQNLSDSEGELAGCWGAFRKKLIGCCTSERTLQRNMVKADLRYREMKRRQEMERQEAMDRQIELCDEIMHRRLDEVVRKYELKRKREEQKERELRSLKEMVRQEWAKAVEPQTWRLTEEEVKDLERLQKKERVLRLKIQRLIEKEAMSETCTCTESECMSEDERGLQLHMLKQKERQSFSWRQQQLEMKVRETLSEPQKCVSPSAVGEKSLLKSLGLLSDEDLALLQQLRKQQDYLVLQIKNLEDRNTKARSKTHKLSQEGMGWQTLAGMDDSQQKIANINIKQHREVTALVERIAQLEKEREMQRLRAQERWREVDKLTEIEKYQGRMREMGRLKEMQKKREREFDEELSREMESLKVMQEKAEMMKDMDKEWYERKRALEKQLENKNRIEIEREREMGKELEEKQHQLEIQIKDMEKRFSKEREMEQQRYEQRRREVERKWQQQWEVKMLEMEDKIERERRLSLRREEELLKHMEHQQKAKMETLRNTKATIEKESLENLDMAQQLAQAQAQVEGQNIASEMACKKEMEREREEMKQQLKEMEQNFETKREMERQKHERKLKETVEKSQEKIRELEKRLKAESQVAQQQELELMKMKKERQREAEMEVKRTTAEEETYLSTEQKIQIDEGKVHVKQDVQIKEKGKENKTDCGEKTIEKSTPSIKKLDWLGEIRQKGEKNRDISQHEEQLSLEDTSTDLILDASVTCKGKEVKAEAEQKHQELEDDWLGGVEVKKDKWSEIRRKHQQSREESRQALEKNLSQTEQTETHQCPVVRQKGRRVSRETDAAKQTPTETFRNDELESHAEIKQKVKKGRRASMQEGEQMIKKDLPTQEEGGRVGKEQNKNNNNISLASCNPLLTVRKSEVMLKQSYQRTNVDQNEQKQRKTQQSQRQKERKKQVEMGTQQVQREMKIDKESEKRMEQFEMGTQQVQGEMEIDKESEKQKEQERDWQMEKEKKLKIPKQEQIDRPRTEKKQDLEQLNMAAKTAQKKDKPMEVAGPISKSPNITDKETITHAVRVKRPRGLFQPTIQPTDVHRSKARRLCVRNSMTQTPEPACDPTPALQRASDETLNGISMDTVASEIKLASAREEALRQERKREEQARAQKRETEVEELRTAVAEKSQLETQPEEDERPTKQMEEKDDEPQVCTDEHVHQDNMDPPGLADVDDVEEEQAGNSLPPADEGSTQNGMAGVTDSKNEEAESETIKKKGVCRKVFRWVNKRINNYYQKKIDRTLERRGGLYF